jgi:DNA-binding GntR family transcriptional regulator
MELNLSRRNLTDDVADIIRKLILNRTLKPGDKINQSQLAEEFVISRGPIREALRLLENEGLINHIPNHGTYVATLSKKDAYEIYTLRALLEAKGAELALPNLKKNHYEKLEALIYEFERTSVEKDLEKMRRLDFQFHSFIIKHSNHTRLINMHQHLDTQLGAMFLTIAANVPIRVHQFEANHNLLLEALKSNNSEQIRKTFSDHYIEAFNDLNKIYKILE